MHWRGLSDFVLKIRRNLSQGTLGEKVALTWRRSVSDPLRLSVWLLRRYPKLTRNDRGLDVRAGFSDHRATANHLRSNPEHLKRIIRAFMAAKAREHEGPPALRVKGQWAQWWLQANFGEMVQAIEQEDLTSLTRLFDNLQRDRVSVGLGSGYENFVRLRGLRTRQVYIKAVWCEYRDKLVASGFDAGQIRSPYVGNPAGVPQNGDVIQIDTLRHLYHAAEIAEWLRDVPNPVVVEIGAGFGGQAWQCLRLAPGRISKFVIFDIPEVAALSSIYLMTARPDLKFRLFDEGAISVGEQDAYDVAIFPHFTIGQLGDDSVDLYHNACSLAEMDRETALAYLTIIERTCRGYFTHINHDNELVYWNEDGTMSRNLFGSEMVPDPGRFKRVFKKPRVFALPEDHIQGFRSYEYLYQRLDRSPGH